jgi:hypothetical protein
MGTVEVRSVSGVVHPESMKSSESFNEGVCLSWRDGRGLDG